MTDKRNIFINGEIVPADRASVSIFDRGFLYGDGIFETMRTYAGKIFCVDEHLDRLRRSAAIISLSIPWSDQWLRDSLENVLAANSGSNDVMVRLNVTRGLGGKGIGAASLSSPTIVISSGETVPLGGEDFDRGWTAVISKIRRNHPEAIDPAAKTMNFLNNILAKIDAESRGADEAVMLNGGGSVVEGSVSNIFIIDGSSLRTPPESDGLLAGITRGKVMEIARDRGIEVAEVSISPQELSRADEVFSTLSSRGVMPVTKIDDRVIGGGRAGRLTAALAKAFNEMAMGKSR